MAIEQAIADINDHNTSAVSAARAASIIKTALDSLGISEKHSVNPRIKSFNREQLLWYAMQQLCSAQLEDSALQESRTLRNAFKALKRYVKITTQNTEPVNLSPHAELELTWGKRYYAY